MIELDLAAPAGVMLLIALGARWLHGSWLAPGATFALAWSALIWMSLLSPLWGAPPYPVWDGALWWMVASTAAFALGSLVGHAPRQWPAALGETRGWPTSPHLPLLIVVGAICGFIYSFVFLARATDPPTIVQLILVPHHAGPILGALYFVSVRTRARHLAWLSLAPGLFIGLIGTGRTAFLAPLIFWFSSALALSVYAGGHRLKLFTPRRMAGFGLFVFGALFVGVAFQVFRSVTVPRLNLKERLQAYADVLYWSDVVDAWVWMQSSFFGHISAFSAYFESAWQSPPPLALGSQTFNGIYRLLGLTTSETDYVTVDGISTNVFTLFKPPIGDFGFVGALMFFLVMGIATGAAYRLLRAGRLWPLPILAGFYVHCVLTGGWFFNYNSVTMSYFAPALYLYWAQGRTPLRSGVRPMRAGVVGYASSRPVEAAFQARLPRV